MKKRYFLGLASLAFGLGGLPALAQQPDNNHTKPARPTDALENIPGPIESLENLQETGRILFKLADENNDGQISQKEAVDAGNLLVGGFFFRADKNGDGILSQEEAHEASESFLAAKPWLRYVIQTAQYSKRQDGAGGSNGNNNQMSPLVVLASAFDSNNDKQLQASELRQAVQTTVQSGFTAADTNRDGKLSPAEVNAAIIGLGRQATHLAFDNVDTDKNGQLSQAEFEKAIVEPARVAFKVVDRNHDGQISREEAQTARQVVMSKVRDLNVLEPSNSPKNVINSVLGNQTQPADNAIQSQPPTAPR